MREARSQQMNPPKKKPPVLQGAHGNVKYFLLEDAERLAYRHENSAKKGIQDNCTTGIE